MLTDAAASLTHKRLASRLRSMPNVLDKDEIAADVSRETPLPSSTSVPQISKLHASQMIENCPNGGLTLPSVSSPADIQRRREELVAKWESVMGLKYIIVVRFSPFKGVRQWSQ